MGFAAKKAEARFEFRADDKTKTAFRSIRQSMKNVTSTANLMRGAAVAVAGAAAFGALVKKSLDVADSVGKLADTIGISTNALQELRFAADLAGIETGAFDKAMAGFAKRVGEARSGTGTLITLLNKLDPALLKNVQAAQNTDEAFKLITESAAGMNNELDKSALLAAAFGRTAGTQMKVLLKNGTEGLEDMRQEARDLGLVMDEVLIRQAEQAKDDITRLTTVIKTQTVVAFAQLAPHISAVSRNLAEATAEAGGFGTVVVDATESAAIGVAHVADTIRGLKLVWSVAELAGAKTFEFYVSGLADISQSLVDLINLVPGLEVTIPQSLADTAFEAKVRVADLGIELQNLIEEGSSVDKVEAFFAKVREEAARLAEIIAATRGDGDPDSGGGAPVDEKAAQELEKLKENAAAKLEVIRVSLLSQQDAENEAFTRRLEVVDLNNQLFIGREEEFNAIKESLAIKHEANLVKIQGKALSVQEKLWKEGATGKLKVVGGVLGDLTVLMNSESKKQFEIGKAAAISQTVISTIVAAQEAYKALAGIPGVGPALGIAAAAAATVAGYARVDAIRGQSFGGGTSPAGSAGGGSATPVFPIDSISGLPTDSQQRQTTTEVTVNFGDQALFTTEQVRDLIDLFNEQIADGVTISGFRIT